LLLREHTCLTAHPLAIVVHDDLSVDVDDGVVPRRHDLVRFPLRRVPVRCDVRLHRLKDDQGFHVEVVVTPDGVAASYVAEQPAVRARTRVEDKRNVIGGEPFGSQRDQRPEWKGSEQPVHRSSAGFRKVLRHVHHVS
jgi:hypothetical protein